MGRNYIGPMRAWAEWVCLFLCTASLGSYLMFSHAAEKYMKLYVTLLMKFLNLLVS